MLKNVFGGMLTATFGFVIACGSLSELAAGNSELVLFDDTPVKGFYGSGWKGTVLQIVSDHTRGGSEKALGVVLSHKAKKGGGVNFYTKKEENYIDISEFQKSGGSLRFYVNAPKGTQDISIGLYNVVDGKRVIDRGRVVKLSDYIELDDDPKTWQLVSVSLKDLASVPYKKFAGIQMRYVGVPLKPLYFDDVLISKEAGKTVPNKKKSTLKGGGGKQSGFNIKRTGDRLIPTFECLGVYWAPPAGAESKKCEVAYREKNTQVWKKGFPLWFDKRNGEYRGSVVGLKPDTEYEVKLELSDSAASKTMVGKTWSENFPIAKIVKLPPDSLKTLTVTESGTESGYILYTSGDSSKSVIDVNGKADYCVRIDASYVIIRGLTLKNAARNGVKLGDCTDVVIEGCDISGWGRVEKSGWGADFEAAIESKSRTLSRIIIQGNKIHNPRADTNNWREDNRGLHPKGPQAVTFWDSAGNHVIRYNEVYSDKDHYFNDIFGGAHNYSLEGFPNRDSDIYGNKLANCWDDGIESEGANCNVRIWGNYISDTYQKIAVATTSVGPIYIWRNILGAARDNDIGKGYDPVRGGFLKTSDKMGGGRIYVFHNTLLQPLAPKDAKHAKTGGCSTGLGAGGPMANVMSRNNILHISWWRWWSIYDKTQNNSNDFDYDLFNGKLQVPKGRAVMSESNGIRSTPLYNPKNKKGEYALHPLSPGFDGGCVLPNFNDGYTGKAPDLGAFEAGSKAMVFGLEAIKIIYPAE